MSLDNSSTLGAEHAEAEKSATSTIIQVDPISESLYKGHSKPELKKLDKKKVSAADLISQFHEALRKQELPLVEELITLSKRRTGLISWASLQVDKLRCRRGKSNAELTFKDAVDYYMSLPGLFPDTLEFLVRRAKEEDSGTKFGPLHIDTALRSVFSSRNCRTLLQAGATVNPTGGKLVQTETPLMIAIRTSTRVSDLACPILLLDAGANPAHYLFDSRTKTKITALSLALQLQFSTEKYTELIAKLLNGLRLAGHLKQQHRHLLFTIAVHSCTGYFSDIPKAAPSASATKLHGSHFLRDTWPYRWIWLKYDCIRNEPDQYAQHLCKKYELDCPDLAARIAYHAGACISQGVNCRTFKVTDKNKISSLMGYTIISLPRQSIPTIEELERRFRELGE